METMYKVKQILNVQNVFLVNPIDIYMVRETEKYVVGYEPKRHTFHYLKYKISRELINEIKFDKENEIKINNAVDIEISKKMKEISDKWEFNVKNVIMELIPTKHGNLTQLYGMIYRFNYRKTGAGGVDRLEFSIPECPIIVNSNTISNVCYKLVSKQISGSGTHQLHTYLIIAPLRGQYVIGQQVWISNLNSNGHRNMHTYPVSVTL